MSKFINKLWRKIWLDWKLIKILPKLRWMKLFIIEKKLDLIKNEWNLDQKLFIIRKKIDAS